MLRLRSTLVDSREHCFMDNPAAKHLSLKA